MEMKRRCTLLHSAAEPPTKQGKSVFSGVRQGDKPNMHGRECRNRVLQVYRLQWAVVADFHAVPMLVVSISYPALKRISISSRARNHLYVQGAHFRAAVLERKSRARR